MEVAPIVYYIVGLAIGFLINIFFIEQLENDKNSIIFQPINMTTKPAETTMEDVKRIRILCFLNTRPATHGNRAVHILETWGRHCNKILFSSTLTDVNLGAIGFNVSDDHNSMWGKEKLMLQFIYKNFYNEYDWFFKGDDDSFAIIENMRFMLSAYSRDDPIYFGYKFSRPFLKWGYFSGGGGYVMSRKAVRIFVEKILTNRHFYRGKKVKHSMCHIETDREVEDIHISVCLDHYNVYAGDSRDLVKRDRFFVWWPQVHLFGSPAWTNWYWKTKYYFNDEGLDCCSNYSIGFHYVNPRYQYTMYYLTYRLQPFGIKRRFSPPPKKKVFSEVARILDAERFNKSLRGY